MKQFEPIEFTGEMRVKYWDGKANTLIRYWAYLNGGFSLLNQSKNYFFILFGSYWTAKSIEFMGYTINPNWVFVIALLGIPFLIIVGRWHLYKAQKPLEYITQHHGSVTGYNPYNIQIEILDQLKELNRKLELQNKAFTNDEEDNVVVEEFYS